MITINMDVFPINCKRKKSLLKKFNLKFSRFLEFKAKSFLKNR